MLDNYGETIKKLLKRIDETPDSGTALQLSQTVQNLMSVNKSGIDFMRLMDFPYSENSGTEWISRAEAREKYGHQEDTIDRKTNE